MRIARFAVGDEVAYGVVVADGANGTSDAQPSESGDPSAGLSVAEISGQYQQTWGMKCLLFKGV